MRGCLFGVMMGVVTASCSSQSGGPGDGSPAAHDGPPAAHDGPPAAHDGPPAAHDGARPGPLLSCVSQAGTRLKVAMVQASGAEAVTGMWDSVLNVPCTFGDYNGVRCLPTASSGFVNYTDAACTKPVVVVWGGRPCGSIPSYASAAGGLWPILGEVTPTEVYSKNVSGKCVQNAVIESYYYVRVGAMSDGAEFQAGARVWAATSTRLTLPVVQYNDGARECAVYATFRDQQRGENCDLHYAAGEIRCLPSAMDASSYADAACTQPAARLVSSAPPPLYLYTRNRAVCPAERQIYQRGAALEQHYVRKNDECVLETDSSYAAFGLGAEIAPNSFELLTIQPTGSGRVRPRHFATADGFRIHRSAWQDTELSSQCFFRRAADGRLRCLPDAEGAIVRERFEDAACTSKLDFIELALPCPQPTYVLDNQGCASRSVRSGAEVLSPVYRNIGSTCSPVSDVRYWQVGPELTAATLVEGVEVH